MGKIYKILSLLMIFFVGLFPIYNTFTADYTGYNVSPDMENVPYQNKLDLFLNKVLESRKDFTSERNYLVFVSKIETKLNTLNSSYSGNEEIKQMLVYLEEGVKNIRNISNQNGELDDFFCELFGDCDGEQGSSSSSSSSSGGTNNMSYVNIVDGRGLTACNNQIKEKLGINTSYSCSMGGGCSVDGKPSSSTNPSANPSLAGACILESVWNQIVYPSDNNDTSSSSSSSSSGSSNNFSSNFEYNNKQISGYKLDIKFLEKSNNNEYLFSNFISYDMIEVNLPNGIDKNTCILRTSEGNTIYINDVYNNKNHNNYKTISTKSKYLDLMCGFGKGLSGNKPHIEIRKSCTDEQIKEGNLKLNKDSIYSKFKCNIIHDRIKLFNSDTAKNYEEYFLDKEGIERPRVTLNISNKNPNYMEKVYINWKIDGKIDNCSISTYDKNGKYVAGLLGQTYDRKGLTNDTHLYPNKSGQLSFYGANGGNIILSCTKKIKVNSYKEINLKIADGVSFDVNSGGDKNDLIKINYDYLGGNQIKINWNIHNSIDLNTCYINGLKNKDIKNYSGSIVFGTGDSNYSIQCENPLNNRRIIKSIKIDDEIFNKLNTKTVKLNTSKDTIKSGEDIVLSWEISGYKDKTCFLKEKVNNGSLNGANKVNLNGYSDIGNINISPKQSNIYYIYCEGHEVTSLSNVSVNVKGNELTEEEKTINISTDIINSAGSTIDSKNKSENNVIINGQCNNFNINYRYNPFYYNESRINSIGCSKGNVINLKKDSTNTYHIYSWNCEGINGGRRTYNLCKIKTSLQLPLCGDFKGVDFNIDYNKNYKKIDINKEYISDNYCKRGNFVKGSYLNNKINSSYNPHIFHKWKCETEDKIIECGIGELID